MNSEKGGSTLPWQPSATITGAASPLPRAGCFFTCRTTSVDSCNCNACLPFLNGPSSTLLLPLKKSWMKSPSAAAAVNAPLGKSAHGSEYPPGRAEFKTWLSQQPRALQPLGCYRSTHCHILLQVNFFSGCLLVMIKNSNLFFWQRDYWRLSEVRSMEIPCSQTPPVKAPTIQRVWHPPVFSVFLSACFLTSETPFQITSTSVLSALLLCIPYWGTRLSA